MKRTPAAAVALLLAFAAITGAGCTAFAPHASPTRRVADAQNVYATTLSVLTDLRHAGKISDDKALEIEKSRLVAAAALDLAKEQAKAGAVSPSDALARFYRAISEINAMLPAADSSADRP